jgi:3-methylcrotonyl-CoA carboxylase alpha subunit
MFNKVLIANRGEIVNRILQTLHRLNIDSVAIYDARESAAPYIKNSTESVSLGTGDLSNTFLNIDKILEIALKKGCDAIHPGYGFLSENEKFADVCKEKGITFIGPSAAVIAMMGNKTRAIEKMSKLGIPVIPNIRGSVDEILKEVTKDFFPCIIKASAGGGGKGMQIANDINALSELLKQTARVSEKYFGDATVYLEKYLDNPRHIEVQILADQFGNVIHLYERECTIQRRFQKIIEESPAETLTDSLRAKIIGSALKIAKSVGYIGAGTIEFLVDKDQNYYFLEMNTRIQVEHAVTEMVTDVDIIEEQLAIAAGFSINDRLAHTQLKGHSIESRIYAEDSENNYNPSPGIIEFLSLPEKEYLRIDSDLAIGREILSDFDPMIAKMIVWGENREQAIIRMIETLTSLQIHGIKTNIQLLISILNNQKFRKNDISTHFLNDHKIITTDSDELSIEEKDILIATATWVSLFRFPLQQNNSSAVNFGRWRIFKYLKIHFDHTEYELTLLKQESEELIIKLSERIISIRPEELSPNKIQISSGHKKFIINYSWEPLTYTLFLSIDYRIYKFIRPDFLSISQTGFIQGKRETGSSEMINAPLSGKIIKVNFKEGQKIKNGDTLLLIESMKMENEIKSPFDGIIKLILVKEGDRVTEGELLLELENA